MHRKTGINEQYLVIPTKNIGGSPDDTYGDIEFAAISNKKIKHAKTGHNKTVTNIENTHTDNMVSYHNHHPRSTAQVCYHHLETSRSLSKALDKENCLVRTGC
jgi:hypothetical protein